MWFPLEKQKCPSLALLLIFLGLNYLVYKEVSNVLSAKVERTYTSDTRMDSNFGGETVKTAKDVSFDYRKETRVTDEEKADIQGMAEQTTNTKKAGEGDGEIEPGGNREDKEKTGVQSFKEGLQSDAGMDDGQKNEAPRHKERGDAQQIATPQLVDEVPQGRSTEQLEASGVVSHVVLISSIGRSGSSFLGGLLASQPSVFYFYEPLHPDIKSWEMTQEFVAPLFQSLFHCNLTDSMVQMLKESRFAVMLNCNNQLCATPEKVRSLCRQYPVRVVKTIRSHMVWMQPLLDDPTINVKVIHLVRDPRGSIISAWKLNFPTTTETDCTRLQDDVTVGRKLAILYPDRFLAVLYEDLCVDPEKSAQTIMSFLGHTKLPSSVHRFLMEHTNGGTTGPSYALKRNTTWMPQQWRTRITQEQLTAIEKDCHRTIKDLGFSLFHNLSAARNLSLPLYKDGAKNSYFTVPY